MKTVFMGTPELAVPALELLAARSRVQCVITQPDRPAGRGKHLRAPAVKEAALRLGLPVWQPESLRGQADDPRLQDVDLAVVMAYGEILDKALLARPGLCINLHASLLPAWRGASPLQAAIRAGDRYGGVSVMRMVRRLDAGPVYLRERVEMPSDLTLAAWHDRMALLAAQALQRFLDLWPEVQAEEQDESLATYCGKLTSDDGHLDFQADCQALERQVRAYSPVPGCWAACAEDRLRIWAVQAEPGISDLAPGQLQRRDHHLLVGCGSGALSLLQVQPAGKRSMTITDWLNGHRLPEHLA